MNAQSFLESAASRYDAALRHGFGWILEQAWVGVRTKDLIREALNLLEDPS